MQGCDHFSVCRVVIPAIGRTTLVALRLEDLLLARQAFHFCNGSLRQRADAL